MAHSGRPTPKDGLDGYLNMGEFNYSWCSFPPKHTFCSSLFIMTLKAEKTPRAKVYRATFWSAKLAFWSGRIAGWEMRLCWIFKELQAGKVAFRSQTRQNMGRKVQYDEFLWKHRGFRSNTAEHWNLKHLKHIGKYPWALGQWIFGENRLLGARNPKWCACGLSLGSMTPNHSEPICMAWSAVKTIQCS